ncbi:MAG: hypothetical protein KGS72_19405 [Cyanobacteria bacterium REEB67]|nr:hypothetical protein [Cyanobacteria bacterium REEB67]
MITPKRQEFAQRILVVGPAEPVDGDSVASTSALIAHLRKAGLSAYTLPTVTMYDQIDWILTADHIHPSALADGLSTPKLTTEDLQKAYDAVLADFKPQEIILVDGQPDWLGFDPRGVKVYTIDHHVRKGTQNDEHAFIQPGPSAGGLLIEHFHVFEPILAVSLLTDTFWLRQNSPVKAIRLLAKLTEHGLDDETLIDMQALLMVKKDPLIIEELRRSTVRFSKNGRGVFTVLTTDDAELHRGIVGELGYFARHLCVVRADGYASLRTVDRNLDFAHLAAQFNGGGHKGVAAAHLEKGGANQLKALEEAFFQLCDGGTSASS